MKIYFYFHIYINLFRVPNTPWFMNINVITVSGSSNFNIAHDCTKRKAKTFYKKKKIKK